jgi:RNA polymerase sigma-B factor
MTGNVKTLTGEAVSAAGTGPLPEALSAEGRSRLAVGEGSRGLSGRDRGVAAIRPAGAATVQDLLRERARLPAGHPDRAVLRARSIEAGLPLARRLAATYRGGGEPLDDLCQVAALALVRAVDAFDPTRQTAFSSYAVPTILGALKRHFRDNTWWMRVPRSIQDLAISLGPASAILTQRLGRSPTLAELAVHLSAAEGRVAIARDAWRARQPGTLDALSAAGGREQPLIDTIGAADPRLEAVVDRHTLRPLLAALPTRQRRILALRYFGDLSQAQIAAEVGVSQMRISRLLARALTQLRAGMFTTQSSPPTHARSPKSYQRAGR